MAYNLSSTFIDQMSLTGKFLASGKKWAHVLYGRLSALSPLTTSNQLLTTAHNDWTLGLSPPMSFLSSDVQLNQMTLKQVQTYKSRFGRLTQLAITFTGTAITGVTITDPGLGYANGTDFAIIWDYPRTGLGAIITLTYAGGVCTAAVVTAGGTGYGGPLLTWATAPLPDAIPGNAYDLVFGGTDFTGPYLDNGGTPGDRTPSFNAYSIKSRSSIPGRNGRGSAHWPGVAEGVTLNDNLTVVQQALVQPAATLWLATARSFPPMPVGANWVPQVFSPQLMHYTPPGAFPGAATLPYFSQPCTTAIVNLAVGSMLRRKIRV